MRLCEICKSIPLGNLPPFPKTATLVSTPEAPQHHYHFAINEDNENDEPSSPGFHYHQDRGGLWQSAAGGCGLCRLVENQARLVAASIRDAAANAVPNFDLWVTARRGAGDGFWVLSGCGDDDDRPDKTFVLVAAVGFCVEKDDPLATVFRGRPVEEVPGETAFGLVRDWLAENADIRQQPGQQSATLPPLLIDVGDGSTVTIVKPEPDGDTRYIALSYPRHDDDGSSSPTHQAAQSTNTPEIAAGSVLETNSLPQTFRDAVSLTRRLGFRHLWVDALCAPGITAAAAVYENAHLTQQHRHLYLHLHLHLRRPARF
ncbi:hypothetical protein MAPG_03770 [Magnaporthiopsis poae ATCC 64411]|uniref:Heterokaryon incompatibility domain-containing protein n=1 Tax=Magnaporthiopsis poae (strain ATCC 64411 / 73-15) TaxID=644358 RepID=A0A0C4DUX3_MAGP6|nr:hypothetical protein MAPG_03770 [Magnaporthiopsis poae ATCC 64411]